MGTGLDGGQVSLALSCAHSPCSPPCSSSLADASWLPIYKEAEEAVDFIVAFVSSLDKVTVASWTVAVLAFGARGLAGLWRGAGWAELPFSQGTASPVLWSCWLCPLSLPHSLLVSLFLGCQDSHKFTFLKSTYVLCKTALKHGLTQGLDLFCQTCEVVENIKVKGWAYPIWCWAQAPLALAPCVGSAWVGAWRHWVLPGPSWSCSAGPPGKGAKGPSVLAHPVSCHDYH